MKFIYMYVCSEEMIRLLYRYFCSWFQLIESWAYSFFISVVFNRTQFVILTLYCLRLGFSTDNFINRLVRCYGSIILNIGLQKYFWVKACEWKHNYSYLAAKMTTAKQIFLSLVFSRKILKIHIIYYGDGNITIYGPPFSQSLFEIKF